MIDTLTTSRAAFPVLSAPETAKLLALRRNGVALAYTETSRAGSETPPLVFIHGWAGDHATFLPQIEHFKWTHRTIAVDLRGHGRSDKPDQNYTVTGFASDVIWLCSQLGVVKPVIIGHSMGGAIALEIAARYPDAIEAIVMIDSVVFPIHGLKEYVLRPVEAALCGPDYREAIRQAIAGLFLPTDDPACRARLMERAATTPQHVALPAFRNHLIDYNASEFAAACKVPVGYIASANPMADLARFRMRCPQLVTGQVMQAGHFAPLVAPDQVNNMLERFLAINARQTGDLSSLSKEVNVSTSVNRPISAIGKAGART